MYKKPGEKKKLLFGLKMECRGQADQSLRLNLHSIEGNPEPFFQLPPDFRAAGKPLRQVLPFEQHLVDEWTENIFKNHYLYQSGAAGEATFKFNSVQFLQKVKRWASVSLSFQPEMGDVQAELYLPANRTTIAELDQFVELKRNQWLDDFIRNGGKWELDLVHQTAFLSRQQSQIFRITDEAVIMPLDRFFSYIHPEDMPFVKSGLDQLTAIQTPIECRTFSRTDEIVYLKSYAVPGYDENGRVVRVIGHSQDLTEQKLMMERLAVNEQRFRGIVESSQDLFVVLDAVCRITYISPHIEAAMGYSPDELMGNDFRRFLRTPEDQSDASDKFLAVYHEKANTKSEYLIHHKDGHSIWFLISASPILDQNGKVVEVVASCRDIDDIKAKEADLLYMSMHDGLTGVFNRRSFEEEMQRLEAENCVNIGLIMTDLNGLKLVNDAFGHQTGDELLITASRILSEINIPQHKVFRVGGDEFAIFVYDCSAEDVQRYCEEIDQICTKATSHQLPISISWGSVHRRRPDQSLHTLYKQAEGHMYRQKLLDSRSMRNQVLASLKETLKVRNVETADHMQRMENMVVALGKRLGLPPEEFNRLVLLASMHDIGKVSIPDRVINKPGPLTDEEWQVMRTHSEVGHRIALTSRELSNIADEICCHHERYDGRGYPYGYRGEQIPLLSRIISVVDSYDVMTHKRVYKEAMSHEEALAELRRCNGTQFDPAIVALFVDIFGSLNENEMERFISGEQSNLNFHYRPPFEPRAMRDTN